MAGSNIKVTIETPKGSPAKYDFNPESGAFELNKVLPAGMVFPFDFGFIPGTLGADGDPLDVLVISEVPVFTACVIDCRIIGCITARQKEKGEQAIRNDRFIGVPAVSALYNDVKELGDLPGEMIQEIESFFIQYNKLAGKKFTPLQHLASSAAGRLLAKAKEEKTPPGRLVQLFLPLYDEQGRPFLQAFFTAVKKKLTEKFGGVTVYAHSPVSGLWEDGQSKIVRDTMVIFEVMAGEIDAAFWKKYKSSLMKKFGQKELLVRRFEVGTL
jgi:inorganic pyrophosphatase